MDAWRGRGRRQVVGSEEREGWHTMSVGICGSASGFLSGADGCNDHAREG
jgi:hypothetical protein